MGPWEVTGDFRNESVTPFGWRVVSLFKGFATLEGDSATLEGLRDLAGVKALEQSGQSEPRMNEARHLEAGKRQFVVRLRPNQDPSGPGLGFPIRMGVGGGSYSLGMPSVINMSFGAYSGTPKDGSTIYERYLDAATGPGRIIVQSAGNGGLAPGASIEAGVYVAEIRFHGKARRYPFVLN